MTVKPWLEKAGRFAIEHIGGIPHFNQAVELDGPRTGVLHTTEGEWDGSLAVFKQHFAPHFLLGNDKSQGKVRIAQLVQVGTIGAALVTHNWIPLVQVEMIGYSKQTLWRPDDETAEAMAALMAACKAEYGIPLLRPWTDGVYGMARANDPHRNEGKFGKVPGWYGHGDCPAPDSHWDPGALEWSHLFALAGAMPEASAVPSLPEPAPPRPCAACAQAWHRQAAQTAPLSFDLSDAKGLQGALKALGYRVTVDGEDGPETEAAVKAFQAHEGGLAVDGAAGEKTQAALRKALAAII
jgi:Putative peptidoglycan binding domain/N-acetylmuramoyl-L-alanine amidase